MAQSDVVEVLHRGMRLPRRLASCLWQVVSTGRRRHLRLASLLSSLNEAVLDLNKSVLGLNESVADLRRRTDQLSRDVGGSRASVDLLVSRKPTNLSVDHSLRELTESTARPGERIAFVTNLPPETTGIATCSFYSWLGHGGPVDVFCPVDEVDWFFGNSLRLKAASQGQMRVFDARLFLTADQINHYKWIVIATGNSNHCLYIHDIIKKAATYGGLERFVLYVHDPCLFNLIQRGAMLSAVELRHMFERIYNRRIGDVDADLTSEAALYDTLVRADIYGPRFFASAGIKRFLVNSQAAYEILRSDLGSPDVKISKIFHPVFLPEGAQDAIDITRRRAAVGRFGTFVIGTFGVPGYAKLTDRIIAAAQVIRRRGIDVRLIIAGYEVRAFTELAANDLAGLNVTVFDGPTDVQLLQCMAEADVAAQLRGRNLGESSGIVPLLLALGKTVLVSDVGSFKEFGQAVRTIAVDFSEEELADTLLHLREDPIPHASIREYVDARTPERFREALMSSLNL